MKLQTLIPSILSAATIGLTAQPVMAAKAPNLKPGQSRTYDFGKNVTPRYGRESVRPDGKSSIVYGNKLTPSGRVAKPHGHTITQPGKTPEYARNKAGKVIVNRK